MEQNKKNSIKENSNEDIAMLKPVDQATREPIFKPEIPAKTQAKKSFNDFSKSIEKFIRKLSRALLVVLVIRLLFEAVPTAKEKLPTIYSWYEWGAQFLESIFKFGFDLIGVIFKGKTFPSLDAFREIWAAFIQLF